jgi:hypothetical protein
LDILWTSGKTVAGLQTAGLNLVIDLLAGGVAAIDFGIKR